jgi:hypothetical protein
MPEKAYRASELRIESWCYLPIINYTISALSGMTSIGALTFSITINKTQNDI